MTVQDAHADPNYQLVDRALPAIAQMEQSLAVGREASRLALHSPSLMDTLTNLSHSIAEERDQLDAVDLIAPRRWAAEEFHSSIISWLLNPSAHHRQAGQFITALLNATMAPPQLLAADWSSAQVLQEWPNVVDGQWGYLDILVLDQDHRNLIAIENKTFSYEHSNQLTRYHRALAEDYADFARHHVLLSPDGVSPYLERDREHWQPAGYTVIHDAIREVLETGITDPDANALLQVYVTTIRRNVMTDTSLDRRARRIYLEHWEAIEHIYANKPDWIYETKTWLREAVAKHSFWRLDKEEARYVRFRAADWHEFPSTRTGTGWAPESDALLLLEFTFDDEIPYLNLALSPAGPGHSEIRAALFDAVRQNPAVFKPNRSSLTDGWMLLHQEPDCILGPDDYGPSWDDGTARHKLEDWIDKFAAEQFPEMNRIIVDCLRSHQET